MIQQAKWLPLIFLVASSLLLLPVFIFPTDWAGWLLIYFSLVTPLLFSYVRRDRSLVIIFILIAVVHNGVSIYNVYGSTIFGATLDAVTFQELARDLATDRLPLWFTTFDSLEVGASVYSRFLASFYRTVGVSLLLGQSLSVLAYMWSCVALIYLAKALRFRFKRGLLILYALPAPAIIYCSITMREAWQVLFFLLVLFLTIKLRIAPSILRAALMILCGLAFGLLHNGLFIYSLLLLGLSVFWGMSGNWREAAYRKVLIRALILGVSLAGAGVWFYFGGEIGGITKAIRTGDAVTYTETYRERGDQDSTANYKVAVDASSPITFITTGTLTFLYYQFAPFPWQVTRLLDAYAALEALLRLLLMIHAVRNWWKARGEKRKRYGYLIITYLSLEFLWALGTGNWGTAARHHVVAYGALVLVGGPGLMYWAGRLVRRLKFRARRSSRLRRFEVKGAGVVG